MRARLCIGIGLAVFASCSASAVAAPVDVASEHVAVRAFDRFLRGLVSDIPADRQSDDAFVTSISRRALPSSPSWWIAGMW